MRTSDLNRWATAFATLLATGCNDPPPPQQPAAQESVVQQKVAAAPTMPVESTQVVSRQRQMMGTVFIITTSASDEATAAPAIAAAMDEIARLEAVLSEWQSTSEISQINAASGDHAVHVGADTLAVVRTALDVSRASDGLFDLSWAALRGLYEFRPGYPHRTPTPKQITKQTRLVNWRDIVVNEQASTVFLRRKGMALGTGGIGKGYALDRAGAVLERAGIHNYMIFGGGQVQVKGRKSGRGWRVGIQHPREESTFAFVESDGGSISTSGDYEHFYIEDGKRWHHILDPRTGNPATASIAVTVVAKNGMLADALTKPCFIRGAEACAAFFREHPEFGAEALVVGPDYRLYYTPGMRELIKPMVDLAGDTLPHTYAGP